MTKMRAVVYEGPFKVSVQEVEKPKILHPCDVIVKGTSCRVLSLACNADARHQLRPAASVEGQCLSIAAGPTLMRSPILCSDLHMYEGRTAAQPGIVFGHENMGIVDEVADGVAVRDPPLKSDHAI